jgi:hypothetical protein
MQETPTMPMILEYREPKTIEDVYDAVRMFVLDQWDVCDNGGFNEKGGEIDFAVDNENAWVQILVLDKETHDTIQRPPDKQWATQTELMWLSPDEASVIEAMRHLHYNAHVALEAIHKVYGDKLPPRAGNYDDDNDITFTPSPN